MVDFIKSVHKRSVLANILHVLFYVFYVAAVLALVILLPSSPWAALGLVVLSKWRVVFVRPRYWWANILSNLPDTLLGMGVVILMWTSASLPVQILLTLFYLVWLVVIKPKHKREMVILQAGLSQFISLWALFSIGYMIPLPLLVLLTFLIGFSTARHALSSYDEKDRGLISFVWGFLVAQLGFVAWHWTIAYSITPTLRVPQIAIMVAVISLLVERGYIAWYNDEKIEWNEIKWTVGFVSLALAILLFAFSGLWDASTL